MDLRGSVGDSGQDGQASKRQEESARIVCSRTITPSSTAQALLCGKGASRKLRTYIFLSAFLPWENIAWREYG
eukprot:scaffold192424_cov33-Tisochrysis_lutea.AAC.4